jgi:hypothetical protein
MTVPKMYNKPKEMYNKPKDDNVRKKNKKTQQILT